MCAFIHVSSSPLLQLLLNPDGSMLDLVSVIVGENHLMVMMSPETKDQVAERFARYVLPGDGVQVRTGRVGLVMSAGRQAGRTLCVCASRGVLAGLWSEQGPSSLLFTVWSSVHCKLQCPLLRLALSRRKHRLQNGCHVTHRVLFHTHMCKCNMHRAVVPPLPPCSCQAYNISVTLLLCDDADDHWPCCA